MLDKILQKFFEATFELIFLHYKKYVPNVGIRQFIGRRASKKPTKTTEKINPIKMGTMPGATDFNRFHTHVFPSNSYSSFVKGKLKLPTQSKFPRPYFVIIL